jgi:hypothetical protein
LHELFQHLQPLFGWQRCQISLYLVPVFVYQLGKPTAKVLAGQQDDTLNVQPTLINRFAGNDIG